MWTPLQRDTDAFWEFIDNQSSNGAQDYCYGNTNVLSKLHFASHQPCVKITKKLVSFYVLYTLINIFITSNICFMFIKIVRVAMV